MTRVLLLVLLPMAVLLGGCVPERVNIGPNGEIAMHDLVLRPADGDGPLEPDTRFLDRLSEIHPDWVDPGSGDSWRARIVWSPDGARVAVVFGFSEGKQPTAVHVLSYPDLEGLGQWRVDGGEPHLPVFSPDGRWLSFFVQPENGPGSIVGVQTIGGGDDAVRVLAANASAGHAWSPDGRRLAVLVGDGSGLDQYSLGTLTIVDPNGGSSRPICGVLFNAFGTVEWVAGRIHFLSPHVELPVGAAGVTGADWAIHSIAPDRPETGLRLEVPADLEGLAGQITSFSRAPTADGPYLLVTSEKNEGDDIGRAYLYRVGSAPRLVHGEGGPDRPKSLAVPSWTDGSTWVYRAEDGIATGRTGEGTILRTASPVAALYRALRRSVRGLGGSLGELIGLGQLLEVQREKPEEMEFLQAAVEGYVAAGHGTAAERAAAIAALGLFPDRPSARAALAARLEDGAVLDEVGLSVRSHAVCALERMVDGTTYPEGASPILDLFRMIDVQAKDKEALEAALGERATAWAERLADR